MEPKEPQSHASLVEASVVLDRLADLEMENRKLADRMADLETRHLALAQLMAASLRLHRATGLDGIVEAIVEITVNVVGSEQLGLYLPSESGELVLAKHVGEDALAYPRVVKGDGPIAAAARTGAMQIAGAGNGLTAPCAVVPLRSGHGVAGVLAIFRLLPQKPALDPKDGPLLELLADQAGPLLQSAAGRTVRTPTS